MDAESKEMSREANKDAVVKAWVSTPYLSHPLPFRTPSWTLTSAAEQPKTLGSTGSVPPPQVLQ